MSTPPSKSPSLFVMLRVYVTKYQIYNWLPYSPPHPQTLQSEKDELAKQHEEMAQEKDALQTQLTAASEALAAMRQSLME